MVNASLVFIDCVRVNGSRRDGKCSETGRDSNLTGTDKTSDTDGKTHQALSFA